MLRLRALGGASLLTDDGPMSGTAAQKRRLALLSLLAVAGSRGMSRDKLATLLWPESDQERARHSLAQWLFTTRRDLRQEDLFLGTAELRLNPARMTSDVGDFERALEADELEEAVALYTGPFLDGFHMSGAQEFERWVDGERARLAACHARALETLAGRRSAAGDTGGALEAWRRLAAADPYNGRVALGLMRAFEAAGDAAGALAHARVHSTLLREELGAEPQPDVAAFAERLRRAPAPAASAGQPVVAASPRPPEATPPATPASPAPPASVASVELPAGQQAPATPAATAVAGGPRRRTMRRGLLAALVLLLFVAGAWAAVPADKRAFLETLIGRGAGRIESNRIVIAPLEDFSDDPALARYGLQVSSLVSGALAQNGAFEVVDEKTSYMNVKIVDAIPRFLRRGSSATALAKETEAGLLVSGSYTRDQDSLRVQVRLTDVAADRVIDTREYTGALGQKFALIRDIARGVATMAAVALDTSVAGGAIRLTFPSSMESFDETREAWDRYANRDVEGFYRHARRASEIDPTYMMPVLMQAYMRSDAREWEATDSLVRILEANRARMSKLEQEGTDMLRAAIRGDMAGHLRGALAVRDASPASPEVRTYAARVAVNANRPAQALEILADVNPSRGVLLAAPWYWNWASAAYHLLGDHARELAVAREGASRLPEVETAVANYGRALAVDGDGDALHELLPKLPRVSEGGAHRRWKIALDWTRELRAHGHPEEARRLLATMERELARAASQRRPSAERFRATVLGDLGRYEEAHALWTRLAADEPPSLETFGNLGVSAARAGSAGEAERIAALIGAREWPHAHGRDAMWQARITATLGRPEAAVELVEIALDRGYSRFFDPGGGLYDEPELHADPGLATLWPLDAFKQLIRPRG